MDIFFQEYGLTFSNYLIKTNQFKRDFITILKSEIKALNEELSVIREYIHEFDLEIEYRHGLTANDCYTLINNICNKKKRILSFLSK